MNITLPLQSPGPRFYSLLLWGCAVAIAGLACFVLPTYLLPRSTEIAAYGHPLIPWFAVAFANLVFVPTMLSFFTLGLVIGLAQPRRWLILGCLALSLPPILNIINIIRDCSIDPTAHNLLPFEFVILGIVSLPVLPGALLGSTIGKRIFAKAV